jgi:hypothetical protein
MKIIDRMEIFVGKKQKQSNEETNQQLTVRNGRNGAKILSTYGELNTL